MIRKVIIVFLLVASFGTATAWVAGFFGPQTMDVDLTNHVWGHVVSIEGSCRVIVADFSGYANSPAFRGPYDEWGAIRRKRETRHEIQQKDLYRTLSKLRFVKMTTLGFCWRGSSATNPGKNPFWFGIFPFWAPCMLFAAYPTLAFIRGPVRRWRRRRKGLCIRCGYNLQGNVSGVCPECGTNAGLTNG